MQPRDAGRAPAFGPEAVADEFTGSEVVSGDVVVGQRPRLGTAAHCDTGCMPLIGDFDELLGHSRRVGIGGVDAVEENIGENLIPEGAAGVAVVIIEIQLNAGLIVKVVGAIIDPVDAILVAFVDPCDSGGIDRAEAGNGFVAFMVPADKGRDSEYFGAADAGSFVP